MALSIKLRTLYSKAAALDNQVPDSHKGPYVQFKSAPFTGLNPANDQWQAHVLAQSCRCCLKASGESCLECKYKGIQNCDKRGCVFQTKWTVLCGKYYRLCYMPAVCGLFSYE